MKKLFLILPLIVISSFAHAKKDIATVKNESKNNVHILFTAEPLVCKNTSKWAAPAGKRDSYGGVCKEYRNVIPGKSVSYEWKFGETKRNVHVVDVKTGDLYASTPERVKALRQKNLTVIFPNYFTLAPFG